MNLLCVFEFHKTKNVKKFFHSSDCGIVGAICMRCGKKELVSGYFRHIPPPRTQAARDMHEWLKKGDSPDTGNIV